MGKALTLSPSVPYAGTLFVDLCQEQLLYRPAVKHVQGSRVVVFDANRYLAMTFVMAIEDPVRCDRGFFEFLAEIEGA